MLWLFFLNSEMFVCTEFHRNLLTYSSSTTCKTSILIPGVNGWWCQSSEKQDRLKFVKITSWSYRICCSFALIDSMHIGFFVCKNKRKVTLFCVFRTTQLLLQPKLYKEDFLLALVCICRLFQNWHTEWLSVSLVCLLKLANTLHHLMTICHILFCFVFLFIYIANFIPSEICSTGFPRCLPADRNSLKGHPWLLAVLLVSPEIRCSFTAS